ncbi:Hsp70 chaperone [Fasciolopsis buskii]|uniref:Hsp70 chaperone n=1 Tax=Fasciolopsis buskii TaxID=27845 RepID=A0A8E0RYL1_9TREM|nr:Hsp70 chaperone [Fasciolopsis buski]
MATIGIDFGTTYSCVASFRQRQAKIILDNYGNMVTPSVVSFTEDECLVGYPAVEQMSCNLENTVYDIKRLIGRSSKEIDEENLAEQLTFEISLSQQRPKVVVQYQGTRRMFDAEEVVGLLLNEIKSSVQSCLNDGIAGVVVTVPASFTYIQREAIHRACTLAGLGERVQLLNEPTAAAIAFGLDNRLPENSVILVYDLGGGTFDLNIMKYHDSIFEVITTRGDRHLGGRDFDIRLMNHLKRNFEKQHKCDLTGNKSVLQRLRLACEKAKLRLSDAEIAQVKLPNFIENIALTATVQRATFEKINQDLFDRTMKLTREAIAMSQINEDSIDEVILIGGSTRIPRIRKMLRDAFPNKVNCTINPNHVVAEGAALYAAKLFGRDNRDDQMADWIIQDVNQLSLGLEDSQGNMVTLIEPNSPLPIKSTHYVTTDSDQQTNVYIAVYEGDHSFAQRNQLLDHYVLEGIEPQPAGKSLIKINFELNAEGMLNVKSTNLHNGTFIHRKIQTSRFEELKKITQQQHQQSFASQTGSKAKASRRIQKEALVRLQTLLKLLGCCPNSPSKATEYKKIKDWLDNNPSASIDELESMIQRCEQSLDID